VPECVDAGSIGTVEAGAAQDGPSSHEARECHAANVLRRPGSVDLGLRRSSS
jgi:hypothetical protein